MRLEGQADVPYRQLLLTGHHPLWRERLGAAWALALKDPETGVWGEGGRLQKTAVFSGSRPWKSAFHYCQVVLGGCLDRTLSPP